MFKVIGSRKNANENLIKSAPRHADAYIGNCDMSVNSESLSDYIFKEMNIRINNCEPLDSKNPQAKSFKVNLNIRDREKLLSAEVWPEGIVCRKYYNPRINKT